MWILQTWMAIERIKPRLHCSLALLKLPFILHLTTHGYSEFLIILLRDFLQTFLSNVQKCEDSSLHLKEKQKLIHQSSRAFANGPLLQERKPDSLCNKQMVDLLTPTYHFYFLI